MSLQINFTGYEQKVLFKEKPLNISIFEGEGEIPSGFTVLKITLDAGERSLLNWKGAIERARMAIAQGLLILWELEFDLESGSLEEDARFLALQLNVQHFNDTIWSEFQDHTFGVALFRGKISSEIVDYLKSLGALLSDAITCFLYVDSSSAQTVGHWIQELEPENLGHFQLILKGAYAEKYPFALKALGWGHSASPVGYSSQEILKTAPQAHIKYGICLPNTPNWDQFNQLVHFLEGTTFRVIPENLLTHEWDGIDMLIVFSEQISAMARRKIQGFLAAGGEVINFPDDGASLRPLQISQLAACPVS